MSRYGWSREAISPYTSMSGSVPAVTDEDFSYITSQDLEAEESRYHHRSHSANADPEDDVLLVKNKGVTFPTRFPAYTIGDGKLRVMDVRDRVGLVMGIPDRVSRHMKLLYKGKQLKELSAPVRDYGVKNNSELMAVLPEFEEPSSPSEEEMVIVGDDSYDDGKSRRRRKKKSKKKTDKGDTSSYTASSPRDSTSTFDAPRSPPAPVDGPMKKLNEISAEFETKWLPVCDSYIARTPSDPKKREDEHRKISESIMQLILLKLDGVESEGLSEVRNKRKELIKQVQAVLKQLDIAKES